MLSIAMRLPATIPSMLSNSILTAPNVVSIFSIDRAEFKLCEELSEEVKGLGHGSIESLGLKVEKKNKALNRIQKMLN